MNGRQPQKRASIKDVAARAGASQTTVSRVLNNTGYPVKAELRQRILQAAKELDYTPNILGRMLKHNTNQELGIIIPTIVNPFYTQVVLGMETEARQLGYGVLLCNTLREADIETAHLQSLFDKRILGIALASVTEEHAVLRSLQRMGLHVVVIDQEISDVEQCARIQFDYLRAGALAAEKLFATGHRNMAFLSSPLNRRSRIELLEGFRLGHRIHQTELSPHNVIIDEKEMESVDSVYELDCAKRLARRLVAMPTMPDGIFVSNDMIAIGVMSELSENGVHVPEDISIVGLDNIMFSAMSNPQLTTIEQPAYEMGRLACRMLADMLVGDNKEPANILLEPKLIERKSIRTR